MSEERGRVGKIRVFFFMRTTGYKVGSSFVLGARACVQGEGAVVQQVVQAAVLLHAVMFFMRSQLRCWSLGRHFTSPQQSATV